MFTILVTQEVEGTGLSGWARRRFPPGPLLEEHRTMGVPWRLIRASVGSRGADWRQIAKLAGSHRGCLAAGKEVCFPADCGLARADLWTFPAVMAAGGVCRLLERQPRPLPAALYDPAALHLAAAEILLEQAGCLMIWTCRPERYELFASRMLEEKGAVAVLCREPEVLRDCPVLLTDGSSGWQKSTGENALVVSLGGALEDCPGALYGFAPPFPQQEKLPQGVDGMLLLSALFQQAGCRGLAGLQPVLCRRGDRPLPIADLCLKTDGFCLNIPAGMA